MVPIKCEPNLRRMPSRIYRSHILEGHRTRFEGMEGYRTRFEGMEGYRTRFEGMEGYRTRFEGMQYYKPVKERPETCFGHL